MSRRAETIVSLLVIVGLVAPFVAASGPLGIGSGAVEGAEASVPAPAPVQDGYGMDGAPTAQSPFAIGDDRFDRTLFEITVYENRSARWRFQFTQRLENDTQAENFETYAAEFRENETDLYRQFVAGGQELTRIGSNVTGREMNATGFSRDARTGTFGNLGIVEMSFRWTNFGQPGDGGEVVIGDVFEGGLAIRSDQRLRIVAGPSLTIDGDSVDPVPSNTSVPSLDGADSIEWVGEFTFADQRPHVAFTPVPTETTADPGAVTTAAGTETGPNRPTDERTETTAAPSDIPTGGTDTGGETTAAGNSMGNIGLGWMLVGLGLIALVVVVATWRLGYLDIGADERGDGEDSGDGGSDAGGSQGGAGSAVGAGGSAAADIALESDDDRVRQLLEDNGGRMKQTAIVEATEWSKSKVSMLLSEMEDDGEVTKLRVGRENIVSLPGAEPEAARSPFADLDEEE